MAQTGAESAASVNLGGRSADLGGWSDSSCGWQLGAVT